MCRKLLCFLLLAIVSGLVASHSYAKQSVIGRVTIPFIQNQGQVNPAIGFYVEFGLGTVFVKKTGELVYSLADENSTGSLLLSENLVGGQVIHPGGEESSLTRLAFFRGEGRKGWRTNVKAFEKVNMGEVWEGIRVELRVSGESIEKIFVLTPSAKVDDIAVRVNGADQLKLDQKGALLLEHKLRNYRFSAPYAYQYINGKQTPVEVAYRVKANQYGFTLGKHDPAEPVIIDPLLQATFLGGSGDEGSTDLVYDPSSDTVYVAATTKSADLPAEGAQTGNSGERDVMIARLSSDLTSLLQVTYFGGSQSEDRVKIRIHEDTGDVYIAGTTTSNDLPGTTGGALSFKPAVADSNEDIFVARLSADLMSLKQSTYLGGGNEDEEPCMEIHPVSGDIYVAGETLSDFSTVPAMSLTGAASSSAQQRQAFISRLPKELTTVTQTTYVGGAGEDYDVVLAFANDGSVYVGGSTTSLDLNNVTGSLQEENAGQSDGFIFHMNQELTATLQATYIGGSRRESVYDLLVHPDGDVFIGMDSDSLDLPGTVGGFQEENAGYHDVYIARISADLRTMVQATYFGGGGDAGIEIWDERAPRLKLNRNNGDLYISMGQSSNNLPASTGGIQAEGSTTYYDINGLVDGKNAFLVRMNSGLTEAVQGTYLGGTGQFEYVSGGMEQIGLDFNTANGNVYISGRASHGEYPGTKGGAQETRPIVDSWETLSNDLYIAVLSTNLAANTTPDPFDFGTVVDVPVGYGEIESDPVTVTGIDGLAKISLGVGNNLELLSLMGSDIEYSIDSGPYTFYDGFIQSGQTVRLRAGLQGLLAGEEEVFKVTIGGVAGEFKLIMEDPDTIPDALVFNRVVDAPLDQTVESNIVTVLGINTGVPISITGGDYSIDSGGYTGEAGTIYNSQTVKIRLTSADKQAARALAVLEVGGLNATFEVITAGTATTDGTSSGGGSIDDYWLLLLACVLLTRTYLKMSRVQQF